MGDKPPTSSLRGSQGRQRLKRTATTLSKDPYAGLKRKGSDARAGGGAGKRRTHTNARADRRGRAGAARDAAEHAVPFSVGWVFANEKRVRHRFTPFQWAILEARFPAPRVKNSSVVVGQILGMTGKSDQVRAEEKKARRTAYELCYAWSRAAEKWKRIKAGHPRINPFTGEPEKLDKYERALLSNHRESRVKAGRKKMEPYEPFWTSEDALTAVGYGPNGETYRKTKPFSDLSVTQRREIGVGDEYADEGEPEGYRNTR